MSINLELALSTEGHLYLDQNAQTQEVLSDKTHAKITSWFLQDYIVGLLKLGLYELDELPPSFSFWQNFVRQLLTQIHKLPDLNHVTKLPLLSVPEIADLEAIIHQAPFIRGFEYLNTEFLISLWQKLNVALNEEVLKFNGTAQDYFIQHNPKQNLFGRVCFHLAENKNNSERPFAFIATYSTQLDHQTNTQHVPLKKALQEYAGDKNKQALLALLLPVQKAAEKSVFIQKLVNSGDIFQALTWDIKDAYQFLTALPLIEDSGIMIRVPNWWSPKNPPRAQVKISIGKKPASLLGLDTLLDFDMEVSLNDGQVLSAQELKAVLKSNDSLVKVKGQWIEINQDKLNSVLKNWGEIKVLANDGVSLSDAMRLLARTKRMNDTNNNLLLDDDMVSWSNVVAGEWLKTTLEQLRNPHNLTETSIEKTLKTYLKATLRHYQLSGVNWLWLLYQLKLGACLADDMGLGKTIQILAFLLLTKYHVSKSLNKPHLLIVPASLIGNWQEEIKRFAPDLSYHIVHGSMGEVESLLESSKSKIQKIDLVITTYSFIHRLDWLKSITWDVIILDEAQAIKNPGAKQTIAIKKLNGAIRFTLTGTPVENRLSDLWSLFDFTSKGLLGNSAEFTKYEKQMLRQKSGSETTNHFMASIRTLTQPYILRRLKSDKTIIKDLPDKTEIQTFCTLSQTQIKLYADSVKNLSKQLQELDGIKRRGVVLSYLMRFKQICNHPAQWLGYGDYAEQESGKLMRLREICSEIAAKQEKVLIFTQFKEIVPQLCTFLTNVFGREGVSLHGETAVKQRQSLVNRFQTEEGLPFFVLSLKAGGTGLNLTRASHVIHFDRWWNPAVENQATDRAYRIGQKHPVMVHKFICRGTIEEKIDEMIQQKKLLSQEILQSGSELSLTELNNDELLNMISLDIHKALGDA